MERGGHKEKPNIGYWVLVYVDETDEKAVAKAKGILAIVSPKSSARGPTAASVTSGSRKTS